MQSLPCAQMAKARLFAVKWVNSHVRPQMNEEIKCHAHTEYTLEPHYIHSDTYFNMNRSENIILREIARHRIILYVFVWWEPRIGSYKPNQTKQKIQRLPGTRGATMGNFPSFHECSSWWWKHLSSGDDCTCYQCYWIIYLKMVKVDTCTDSMSTYVHHTPTHLHPSG